jgi:hypothetical protein
MATKRAKKKPAPESPRMYYFREGTKNFKARPGMVVVHNHVMHSKDMPNGWNGFRVWQQVSNKRTVKCRCGWMGVDRCRIRGMGTGRSVPYATIERMLWR